MVWRLLLPISAILIAANSALPAEQAVVVGVVQDFANFELGPVRGGRVDHWRWNDAERDQAARHSRVECVADQSGRKRLHVRIDGPLPQSQRTLSLLHLAPHFPPEADAVRLHVEVVSGTSHLFLGGPTAYYGDSDVHTLSHRLGGLGPADKKFIADLSLNHPLIRNYRRAGFSTDARRIYYTRWAQEPFGVFLAPQSRGEFYIDRIELVSLGEGRPFPQFDPADVRAIRSIADFEDGKLDAAFNLYMADGETEWFEQSWKREKPLRFAPAELSIAADDERGAKSLVTVGRYAEEVHCTGIYTPGAPEANAVRVELTHDAPEQRNTVVGLGRAEPVDFFLFTAPLDRPFPWDAFGPDAELRHGPGPGFDYQFSYRAIRGRSDVDFAVYQTRRYVRPQERTTLVLPVADFACVYGSGKYRDRFLADASPSCDDVIAVAWLTPWCRAGRGNSTVTTRIDELTFVRVPGQGREHRSFWRIDDWSQVQWFEEGSGPTRRTHLYLRNDGGPHLAPGPNRGRERP